MWLQLVFFIILKSRQLATAVQLQMVWSSPVSGLFAVLLTGLLNSSVGMQTTCTVPGVERMLHMAKWMSQLARQML